MINAYQHDVLRAYTHLFEQAFNITIFATKLQARLLSLSYFVTSKSSKI